LKKAVKTAVDVYHAINIWQIISSMENYRRYGKCSVEKERLIPKECE